MSTGSRSASPGKLVLVFTTYLITFSWLWAQFFYPERWKDQHGYQQLGDLVIASALHFLIGIVLLIASRFDIVRPRFGLLACLSPFIHCAGTPFEYPGYLFPFIAPSVAILIFGLLELIHNASAGMSSTVDNEP